MAKSKTEIKNQIKTLIEDNFSDSEKRKEFFEELADDCSEWADEVDDEDVYEEDDVEPEDE